jgi:hypothetical protein
LTIRRRSGSSGSPALSVRLRAVIADPPRSNRLTPANTRLRAPKALRLGALGARDPMPSAVQARRRFVGPEPA